MIKVKQNGNNMIKSELKKNRENNYKLFLRSRKLKTQMIGRTKNR